MHCPVDWYVFKSKFKGASQDVFEYLSYLVFCRKFGLQFGIAGYRNHPGIEKKSIKVGNDYIGFQAKFFLEKFADKKGDIKEAVLKAKKQHPEITVLMFFMPMDHDYSPKKKGNDKATKAQLEVEKAASTAGLKKIEWFCHSEFQATFADESYKYWGAHFFHSAPDIFDLVESVDRRKEQRFCNAKNSIEGNGFHVAIDRSAAIQKIKESPSRAIVVTGDGGVGKTALLKSLDEAPPGPGLHCLGLYELADFFGEKKLASSWHIGLKDFLDLHADCSKRILVVDEAEKTELLFPAGDTGTIAPILADFHDAGWKIIFSTRPSHAEMWVDFCKTILQTPPTVVEIPRLAPEELKHLADTNGFSIPSDLLIRDLIRIPFYLKEFLFLSEAERSGNFNDFKRHLWNCRIRGNDPFDMTSKVFVDMMDRRLRAGTYWVDVRPDESEAAKGLLQRGILVRDTDAERFYLAHDIYEEWALEKTILRVFEDIGDTPDLWPRLQDKPAMHRAYRSWMTDNLHLDGTRVKNLVESSLTGNPTPWQRETLLAMMASPTGEDYLKHHLPHLLSNGGQLLQEIEALVRLSCREPAPQHDETFLKDMGYDPESAEFRFLTRPCGHEWNTLIHFLYENRKDVLKVEQDETLKLLHEWCITHPKGSTTADAARLALEIAIANNGTTWDSHLFDRTNEKALFETLSFGAAEIKEELGKCIGAYLDSPKGHSRDFPANYCAAIIDFSMDHVLFIITLPGLTQRMLQNLFQPTSRKGAWENEPERKMGISRHGSIGYRPLSAYQTPIYWLLKWDFKKTLDFLIGWLNALASTWAQSDTNTTTTIFTAENGTPFEQYISDALWCANRGSGSPVLPRLFVCAHMALEKVLLENDAKCQDENDVKRLVDICRYIFLKAKTASLSGVVNTLVLKNPERYFEVGSLLASSFEAIQFDLLRAHIHEVDCRSLYSLSRLDEVIYWKERERTLNEDFRKTSLQNVIVRYQLPTGPGWEQRRKRMESILDGFSQINDKEHTALVCRTDGRRLHFECEQDEKGRSMIVAHPQFPPEMAEEHQKWQKSQLPIHLSLGLKTWAEAKIIGKPIPEHLRVYETDRFKLLSDCQTVLLTPYEGTDSFFLQNAKPVICAALLKCCRTDLGDELRMQCKQIVIQSVQEFFSASSVSRTVSILHMADVFSALAVLADDPDPELAEAAWGATLFGMLQESDFIGIEQGIFNAIRQKAEVEGGYEQRFLVPYLRLKTEFDKFLENPDVKKALWSGTQSPEELFVEQRADFLEKLNSLEKGVASPAIETYSAEAAKNSLAMIPAVALGNGVCKSVFLENIERVLQTIYHVNEYGCLQHEYLNPAAQNYRTSFARLFLHLGVKERANALAQVAKVPLALSESHLLAAIVHAANMANARNIFWETWTTLRPEMGKLLKNRGRWAWQQDVEEAFDAYFLGRRIWFGHPEACQLVGKDDLQFFMQCLEEWGMPLVAVVAFQSFLASAGLRYWEEGMPMLGSILARLQVGTDERLEKTLANICGQHLKQMFKEHGGPIRKRLPLRQAAQSIIRFLKAEKSQAGYDLENYVM